MSEIRKARLEAKLTQQEMSEKMSIPKRTIEEWERNNRKPPEYVERLVIAELQRIGKENNQK